ncbi:MAG: hypothetical protein KF893_08705 [Caldilineaceae bacterium]|nr:hypothetical protein [Caldilineaceae bacterium]
MLKRFVARAASIFILLSLLLPQGRTPVVQAETAATPDEEIIYIDAAGYIRIIDPNVAPGTQEIRWVSPEGGWYDFATGDFNGDGDAEIAAIGNGKLTIFDPVVQPNSGVTPHGEYNLVPWVRLFEMPLPGDVTLQRIGAGNLDQGVPGDEIIVGYPVNEPNNINYRLRVIKRTDAQGHNWIDHVNAGFGMPWKVVEVGNITGTGSDDIVRLRDADISAVEAVQIDNNWQGIFSRDRTGFLYTSAAIGRLYGGATREVALTRTFGGTTEAASVIIYRFVNNNWVVDQADELRNFPHPHFVFFADINGSGDDELFWMRDTQGSGIRMVMVNRGSDNLPAFELALDADNGYRVGAGGDVDGDGREEVVIMRNNRILLFENPEVGSGAATRHWDVSTNSRSLATANVDGNGFVAGNRFSVDVSAINVSLTSGSLSDAIRTIRLTSIGNQTNIPFTVEKERGSTWFTISASDSNTTPANLFITGFNATQLKPGVYTDRLVIRSTATVLNQPFYVPITLTVTEVSFNVSRNEIGFAFPAQNPTQQVQTVVVSSPFPGLTYSAALIPAPAFREAIEALGETPRSGYLTEEGDIVLFSEDGEEYRIALEQTEGVSAAATWPSVPWATVESTRNIMDDTITITAAPQQMAQQVEHAILLIVADERAGVYPNNIAVVRVTALKDVTNFVYMPTIFR